MFLNIWDGCVPRKSYLFHIYLRRSCINSTTQGQERRVKHPWVLGFEKRNESTMGLGYWKVSTVVYRLLLIYTLLLLLSWCFYNCWSQGLKTDVKSFEMNGNAAFVRVSLWRSEDKCQKFKMTVAFIGVNPCRSEDKYQELWGEYERCLC